MKKGQIILFVMVLLVISLIIVSSVATRSLTGLRTTSYNADSRRAFNAAESGIEEILNKSSADLVQIADDGPQDTSVVDRSNFSEVKYEVVSLAAETPDPISRDVSLLYEFNSRPTNLKIHFQSQACVELSFLYNQAGSLVDTRRIYCRNTTDIASAEAADTSGCDSGYGLCHDITSGFPSGITPRLLIVKVVHDNSKIKLTMDNIGSVLKTKFVRGTAWAKTTTDVKKQIEVRTKTTRDVFPIFGYALYLKN